MKRLVVILVGVSGFLALHWALAAAQSNSYALDWWTVDGGGGASSGGDYTLGSAIGQPDAGQALGGAYSLHGGFWGVAGPALSVSLTPLNPPIVIPPQGGSYQYEAQVANNTNVSQSFDAWVVIEGPGVLDTVGPLAVNLGPGQSASRILTQEVPGAAPAGIYTHSGFVGTFPDTIINSDSFTWEKSASRSASDPTNEP